MTSTYQQAKSVVSKLVQAGYTAYFAGGWVRDYLMGHPSEDIDIATDAPPSKILDLFPQTIPVGLAFGVVIVVIEEHQFEVATFRKDFDYTDGRRPQSIELSIPTEDALRRDFTINGMFYDPLEECIHDYVHGKEDIKHRLIKAIGDPQERFFEDRLRILRAFRFAARFDFTIELETQEAIVENAPDLFPSVAMERVWQEFTKMSLFPRFDQALVEMHRLGVLKIIFPEIEKMHLNEVRHRVAHFTLFPKETPTIFYLMEVFYFLTSETKLEIAKRLKISNKDLKRVEAFEELATAYEKKDKRPAFWAKRYAHPEFALFLTLLGARIPEAERAALYTYHQSEQKRLAGHIERIKKVEFLVSPEQLKAEGIRPSPKLGALLKKGEELAINQNIENPCELLNILKKDPLWTSP